MSNKNIFGLWSPTGGATNDMAFSCYAQAQEGDFTAGKEKINRVAEILAYNWIYNRINPNDPTNYKKVCEHCGVSYDSLLSQEIDYLAARVEREIRKYEAY